MVWKTVLKSEILIDALLVFSAHTEINRAYKVWQEKHDRVSSDKLQANEVCP